MEIRLGRQIFVIGACRGFPQSLHATTKAISHIQMDSEIFTLRP